MSRRGPRTAAPPVAVRLLALVVMGAFAAAGCSESSDTDESSVERRAPAYVPTQTEMEEIQGALATLLSGTATVDERVAVIENGEANRAALEAVTTQLQAESATADAIQPRVGDWTVGPGYIGMHDPHVNQDFAAVFWNDDRATASFAYQRVGADLFSGAPTRESRGGTADVVRRDGRWVVAETGGLCSPELFGSVPRDAGACATEPAAGSGDDVEVALSRLLIPATDTFRDADRFSLTVGDMTNVSVVEAVAKLYGYQTDPLDEPLFPDAVALADGRTQTRDVAILIADQGTDTNSAFAASAQFIQGRTIPWLVANLIVCGEPLEFTYRREDGPQDCTIPLREG